MTFNGHGARGQRGALRGVRRRFCFGVIGFPLGMATVSCLSALRGVMRHFWGLLRVRRHFIPRCRRPRFRHRIGAAAICPFQTAARRHAGVTAAARSAGATVLVVAGAPAPPFLACAVERVIPVDFHFSILMSRKAAIHFRQCLTASSYGINAYRPSCLLAKHRRTPASAIAILFTSVSSGAVTPN